MPTKLLKGSLKLGADSGSATEVGDEITHFSITGAAEDIQVPAVLSTGVKGHLTGSSDWSIGLNYLVNPDDATGVSAILLDAIMEGETVYFEGTFFEGAVSATNKKWSGYFIPTSSTVGGDVGALMSDSQTFPLTEKPTIDDGSGS